MVGLVFMPCYSNELPFFQSINRLTKVVINIVKISFSNTMIITAHELKKEEPSFKKIQLVRYTITNLRGVPGTSIIAGLEGRKVILMIFKDKEVQL